ncbi:ADP-ribosylation factor-like protein 8B [Aspergillus arachidicola]|uniref:ADP-ribosylation factor-like protein 8B n=1 Tax=Aspergillus arachidicola TaxID=656916 RepID=A0A2G7FPM7_9EURO|nr:ADP-ribosylation factor-like protein 8B [Aspergillus arachidicola]
MAGIFRTIYDWLLRMFWATEMDVTMIGLQNAGKSSLLRVLAGGEFTVDSIPTIGFNTKRVQKGHVTLKCWDLGGQPRFRPMWERYCRGVNAIVYIVDAADRAALPVATDELHELMNKPTLEGIPLLVLGNKSDLPNKLSVDELIDAMDLKSITHREHQLSSLRSTSFSAFQSASDKEAFQPRWVSSTPAESVGIIAGAIGFADRVAGMTGVVGCHNARRRRTRGLQPHPGTAWLAGPPPYGQQHQHPYYADPHYQQQPPPQYTPQPQAYGYFGGQQTGIELQSPPNAYHNGPDRAYQPPPGPPPNGSKV